MSVNVSGERATGPGGGGFFGKSGIAYERPVRSGEGVGDGCCAKALVLRQRKTSVIEADRLTRPIPHN